MDKDIAKAFALYANKTESDYWIYSYGFRIPTQTIVLEIEDIPLRLINEVDKVTVYKNEFIEKLHPDNIDSRKFWKMATSNFPLFSIAGGVSTISSIYEANAITFFMATHMGCIDVLKPAYSKKPETKILEIGPGHGGFKDYIEATYNKNYWAIDVNPLFEHPNIYQTDGKTIPDTIPYPMDIVYSINVFQHLSKAQRTSYYRQAYEILVDGGLFVFGMFVITPENKTWPCWGTKGENGRYYCNFFKQLTEIDNVEEVVSELEELGYTVTRFNPQESSSHYLTFKCVK